MDLTSYPMNTPTRPLGDWTVEDVINFIESGRRKFGDRTDAYKQLIIENDVDGELLVDMTDDQLVRLGIASFGHRHFILKRIQTMTGGAKNMASPPGASTTTTYASSSSTLPKQAPQSSSSSSQSVPTGGIPNLVVRDDKLVSQTRQAQPRLHQPTPRINEAQVTVGRKIGSGSVGHVYEGKYEQHPVAIKKHKLDGSMMDQKALIEFEIEVGKMTAVNHPCIVRCYGMLEPSPGIVMELVQGGSLFQILHGERGETFAQYNQRLHWFTRLRFLLDAMYGLRAVHNAGLIHGDFKTLNLLVGPDQRVKVADFGLSKVLDALSVLPGTKTITGTPQYMAPEVMLTQPQGMRVDIYSVGIVMWEVLTGAIPWKGMDIVQIIHQVTQEANKTQKPPPGRPPVDNMHLLCAPLGYVQVMHECWSHYPNERPSTDQVVVQLEAIQRNVSQQRANTQKVPAFAMGGMQGMECQQGMPGGFDHMAKRQRIGDPQLPNFPPNAVGRASNMGPPAIPAWAPPMPTAPILSGPKVGSLNPPPMFLAAGGMDYLVDMMQGQDVKQQKQAAQVVFEACTDNPSNQELLKNAGGVPQMVKLLKDGSTEVQSKMAAAIAAACADNRDNRNQALKANAMAPLIDLLDSKSSQAQENAANALANIIKKRTDNMADASGDGESDLDGSRGTGSSGNESSTEEGRGDNVKSGQAELNRRGGLDKLLGLLQSGAPRVKEAAAAAIANAMADHKANREAFQQAGGVAPMLGLLKTGDPMAQENATTALWNAMVDNEACKNDLIRQQGMPVLVQVLCTGTDAAQERAAGAIWKSCVNDPSIKEQVKQAIPGLVQLLRTGSPAARVQAAGALRSACINSAPNKRELNRVNGISALVECLRSGMTRAREQAGAALANACANSPDNQNAARHAGAMQVLVDILRNRECPELLECASAAVRNLCVNSIENREELFRCGGIQPLLMMMRPEVKPQLLEYTIGAVWKACTKCDMNKSAVLANGLKVIEELINNPNLSDEIKRCAQGLLAELQKVEPQEQPRPVPAATIPSEFDSPAAQPLEEVHHLEETESAIAAETLPAAEQEDVPVPGSA
uniref:Protein kinase domain-containing protein n=1 Tax=Hanusia phi TaxID=3032 RepID=A0A7S0ESI0_9CRYP|mmetsp:Transcript_29610/g.67005  ORF Transcript_29610/g.67005 Transcript_29610/m.67005 type:complete len:1085 (+) Transcript_29610:90-3344(+)